LYLTLLPIGIAGLLRGDFPDGQIPTGL